jgi:hypothetical protein
MRRPSKNEQQAIAPGTHCGLACAADFTQR